ncbi:MAG TPA: nitrilase-related carbon-nitrogen hydrolase, partial [Caulobacteraceae bacterium]|nr:nitrilase-related carbon-nitrogen hydrolase [Caulobacteraceae bacterium]
MPPDALPVALVQLRTPDEQAAALAHVEPLIREAAGGGAKLILTPEGTNILEQRREKRLAKVVPQDQDVAVAGLRALAAELGVWLLIGSAIVRGDDPADPRAANRSLLIGPDGAVTAAYDKLHVFDVD